MWIACCPNCHKGDCGEDDAYCAHCLLPTIGLARGARRRVTDLSNECDGLHDLGRSLSVISRAQTARNWAVLGPKLSQASKESRRWHTAVPQRAPSRARAGTTVRPRWIEGRRFPKLKKLLARAWNVPHICKIGTFRVETEEVPFPSCLD